MKVKMALVLIGLALIGCTPEAEIVQNEQPVEENDTLHVYLIRHAEAYSNIRGSDMRAQDGDALTTKGFEQANALGEYLEDKNIVAVVSSPANRAQQTADTICKMLGLEQGHTTDEAFFSAQPGESMAESGARAGAGIERLLKAYPGKAVAIISHSEICAPLMGRAANTPIEKCYQLHKVNNGTYSELIITEEEWQLISQGLYPKG
jgi:broad specificity phosphatase PhoE